MKIKRNILLTACLVVLLLILGNNSAFATGSGKYSVSISPIYTNLSLDPGSVHTEKLTIKNTGLNKIDFIPSVQPYRPIDHTYESNFAISNQYTEISEWIDIENKNISLEPGESTEIEYTINVPADAHGGSQYAVVGIYTESGGDEIGFIQSGYGIHSGLHADISGDATRSGYIALQKINGFLFEPPISGIVSVANTGNIASDSTTTVRITNALTGAEAYNNTDKPIKYSIVPETIRDYEFKWENSPRLGIFNVTVTTSFVDETATISKTIFICPLWIIVVILLIIILVIAMAILRKSRQSRIKSHGFKFKN